MGITTREVLGADLILIGVDLLDSQQTLDHFRSLTDPDLQVEAGLTTEMPSGITNPSRTVSLSRERMVLFLSSSRSSITKEYPSKQELERLSEVAAHAINCSDLGGKKPQAFGYNISLVYEQNSGESALQYIGNRLFRSQSLTREHWGFTGGTGTLSFNSKSSEGETLDWTVHVRPRSTDRTSNRVFLGMNLHNNSQRMPNEAEISSTLRNIWREANEFINRLDQSG